MHLFILQFFKTGFDLFERKTGTVVPLNEKKMHYFNTVDVGLGI